MAKSYWLINSNSSEVKRFIKNEGRIKTTFMKWGFISPWAKDPFDKDRPRPFNARSETVEEKKLFSGSWKHKRCLIPASGFFEKKYRVLSLIHI